MLNTSLFDKVLIHKDSNQYIVANPYLHVLNAHPEFLKKYNLSKQVKIWFFIKSRLVSVIGILQSILNKKHYNTQKQNFQSDILFVSHLTNSQQMLRDSDNYFGDLPNQLLQQGMDSSIALINHIKMNNQRTSRVWEDSKVNRFILNSSLDFLSEIKLHFSQRKAKKQLKLILKDLRINKALVKDILHHHLSSETFNTLRVAMQVADIVRKTGAKFIVTTYEGYAWERLVYYYAREANPDIKCFGYQHAAVFKHQHAIKRSLEEKYNPDVVLTSGIIAKDIFEKSQIESGKIACLGSYKHRTPNLTTGEAQCCLVVPEGLVSECLILFKLSLGYAKQYPDQQFIWRLHPLLNFDDIRKHGVSLNSLPSNIHLSENSLDDDIQKCDSALYRGSTAIVNAINAGLKPIYYKQSTDELSIDPIYQYQKGKEIVHNQKELNLALNKDIDMETKQALQDFAQDFYTPLNVNALLNETVLLRK